MSALYYHQIVVYILALLPSSLTQLTGSITTTDNRFVITISISNPTYNTISILKSNNVFDDQLDLPVSFTVKDDEGNEAPFATTYAMRSGISNNDLYVLKPGQTFSRIYDIRQFLQSIPSVKHGLYTKTIQIIPPATFQGVMSNGPYNVPAEAAADLSSGTLGNFAAARLIDIRLQAKVLLTAHNFPIYQNPDPGDSIPADGVQLDTASCMGQNATDLSNTIFDAGVYAKSLVSAAEDFSSVLFPQFFQSSQRLHVKAAGNLAANALQGNGFHVDAYCSDIQNLCDAKGSVLGYSFTPSFVGSSYVILCPAARNLGRAPVPCSPPGTKQLSASASHVMFHLLMTLNNVVGSVVGNNYYGVQSCQQLVKRTPVDVTSNADSYAQLAIAQWGFGLGGAPYRGPSCLPANGLVPANERRDVQTMQDAKFLAETIASRSLSRRQFPNYTPEEAVRDAQDCAGDQLTLIQNAATNARALASAARGSQNNDLWTQYDHYPSAR